MEKQKELGKTNFRLACRKIAFGTILTLSLLFVGCGGTQTTETTSQTNKEPDIQVDISDNNSSITDNSQNNVEDSLCDVSDNNEKQVDRKPLSPEESEEIYQQLSTREFTLCSGAGGWYEEFTIEKDGTFAGNYLDSDMGSGNLPNGVRYVSQYVGQFYNLVQINETTYEVQVEWIQYQEEPGTQEIADECLYEYTDSPSLGGENKLTIFFPGTSLSNIPEDVSFWYRDTNQSETELTMIAFADLESDYRFGVYSCERKSVSDEVEYQQRCYNQSYEFFWNEIENETMEDIKAENSTKINKISEAYLQTIWRLVKYNVEESQLEDIIEEQQNWLEQREAKEAEMLQIDSSILGIINKDKTVIEMTRKRCEELINYLQ